jgi:hypothetical protein
MGDYSSFGDFRERAGYEIGGVWYPRVTSIVAIKAKPALYRYYAQMPGMRAADEAKERSAEEGGRVHDAVEAVLKGHQPIVDEFTRPAVEAFTEFLRNTHVEPLLIEERLVSRAHGYAGTVDVVARINDVVGVLDIKTSKAIYRDYGMQTAAYAAALREEPSHPQPQASWILRLDQCRACSRCGAALRTKGGNVRVTGKGARTCLHDWGPVIGQFEFHTLEDQENDLKAFLAAKALWEWEYRDYLNRLAGAATD